MRVFLVGVASVLLVLVLVSGCVGTESSSPVTIGSKNFTESVILGEIVAQTLESAGCIVDRRLNLGGTMVCHRAIESGGLDVYVEYSGTALTAIFDEPITNERARVEAIVRDHYDALGLEWGPALGFNNTFAMIIRQDDAERLGLVSVSDLEKVQSEFSPGFGYEFVERPDGWPGLQARYGLSFRETPRTMDLGLTYRALAAGEIDLIAGNSTDGLIDSLGLVILDDDRSYFPPYDAAVVRRRDLDDKCPAARVALDALGGRIDDTTMRRLNFAVDGEKRDVAEVAREFLRTGSAR